MWVASLFSGGKDSTYSSHLAEKSGYRTRCLVSMTPMRSDSWMFHTINLHLTPLIADALGHRILRIPTSGEKEQELEALRSVLMRLDIDGVVSGAISSSYQRNRIDSICSDLGLDHFAPLWGRDPEDILVEEVESGMKIIITAVAAAGLDASWLGRELDLNSIQKLKDLNIKYGLNICGEGGEYETLVVDAPWFTKYLEIKKAQKIWEKVNGVYRIDEFTLRNKSLSL